MTNSHTYLPGFDCFVEITKTVLLIDNTIGYIVSNPSEGINDMLVRPSEMYGTVNTIDQ